MNTGTLTRAGMLAVLITLTGCGTAGQTKDQGPILSAADAQAMIRVEVTILEPPADLPDAPDAAIAVASN